MSSAKMGIGIGSFSWRVGFTRELQRAARIPDFVVVAEGSYDQILRGDYRGAMNPKAAWKSVLALQTEDRDSVSHGRERPDCCSPVRVNPDALVERAYKGFRQDPDCHKQSFPHSPRPDLQ
jgi:hypothetical protein